MGGQADAGADFAGFISRTGTDGFTQIIDDTGTVYDQFGANDRSIFLFINQDGTFEYKRWGVASEADLSARLDQLIAA